MYSQSQMSKAAGRQRARWLQHCMEEGLGQQTSFETGVNARPPSASLARSLAASKAAADCGAERRSDAASERESGAPTCSPASGQARKEASCSGTPTKYPTRTGQEHGMAADLISLFLFRGGRCPLPQRGRRAPHPDPDPALGSALSESRQASDGRSCVFF